MRSSRQLAYPRFFSALLLVNCAWAKTVGKLPGVFSVNGNGGANYSVPINVPPGTKGIEPELALSYNSQSKNGLLGVGWQLKGLHAIARCVQTREQDGEDFIPGIHFNYEDRFCLDGQRLMVTAGQYGHDYASYRKERDDWSQVESYGTCGQGPCHFRVIDKNNISYEFGNSADSRIEAKARPEVAVWYINKITDQHGNYLTYTYIEDRINGESRISAIRYTANDNAGVQANKRIDFVYEDRADTSFHYQHGQKYNNTKRLRQIITKIDGSIEKTYTLVYEYGATTKLSRLNSIKVCASRTSCLPATKFRYTDNALNNISLLHGAKPLGDWEDRGSARERKYLVFDADMDGLNDIMSIAKGHNGISGAAKTFWKNNGNGFTDTGDRNIGGWSDVTAYDARQYLPMDVNADGANDIVEIYKGKGTESAYASVWYNGGDGTFGMPARCPFGQDIGNWSNANGPDPHRYLVMDVNSDKRPDIVDIYRCRGRRTCATSLLNNVEKFNFCFLPFMPSSLFSSFSESVSEIGGWTDVNAGDARRYLPIDVNGDGVPDLVEIWKNKSNAWATVWLGDGKGSFSTPNIKGQWIGGWEDVNSANQHHYIPMNLNGDSLLDIVEIWRNGDLGAYAALWINRGDNTFEKHQGDTVNIGGWSAVNGPHARRYLTADINGNGRDDLIEIWHHGNTNATHATIWLNNNRGFDLFNPDGTHIGGWTDINSPDARRYSLMDVNGDGISEILEIYKVNNNHTNASVWSFRNTVPDLLSSVTDGLGKLITISYKPITDHSVYKRDVDLSISSVLSD